MNFSSEIKNYARGKLSEQFWKIALAVILAMLSLTLVSSVSSTVYSFFYVIAMFNSGIAAMIFYLIAMFSSLFFNCASLFLVPFTSVGVAAVGISSSRGEKVSVLLAYTSCFKNFARKLGGVLWKGLWISLWSLLFIIPGIIKYYSYYFTEHILADCPNVKSTDALKLSMRMTDGVRLELALFDISFFGWLVLTILTLGLLGIYTVPYYTTARAALYDSMKRHAIESGKITELDLNPIA